MQKTQEAEVQNSEYFTSDKGAKEISEKDVLLEEYDQALHRVTNISFKNLLLVYAVMLLFLAIVLPKIYISNQIYYSSKNINNQYHKYMALKEENAHLQRELELIRYQLEVLDDIGD